MSAFKSSAGSAVIRICGVIFCSQDRSYFGVELFPLGALAECDMSGAALEGLLPHWLDLIGQIYRRMWGQHVQC